MSPVSAPASVLLICPAFFSYHTSIARGLEERGYRVVWWNDRPSETTLYKLLLRLFPRLIAPLSARHYAQRLRQLEGAGPFEQVLVVKGESLSRRSVASLRAALPDAHFSYYTWDGLRNVRGAEAIVGLFDAVATFDPVDALERGWKHRPLFARQTAPAPVTTPARYDWAFIGTLHSDRYRVVRRLARTTAADRFYAFLFVPSRLLWVLRMASDWQMWAPGAIRVSLDSLAATEARRITAGAAAVLDIEHPNQRGLTMRSIETLLAGHKLVTTNPHIRQSDLYHPSRVCVIDRGAPSLPAEFLETAFLPIHPTLRDRYGIDGWLRDLLPARHRAAPQPGNAPQSH